MYYYVYTFTQEAGRTGKECRSKYCLFVFRRPFQFGKTDVYVIKGKFAQHIELCL